MSIEFINPPSAPPSAGGYRQLAIVPLAGGEGVVAALSQRLRQDRAGVEPHRGAEQRLAAHEHRAARQAGGRGH